MVLSPSSAPARAVRRSRASCSCAAFTVQVFERDASATAHPQGGSLDLRPDSGQRAIDAAGLVDVFARFSRDEAKAFRMIDSQGDALPGMGEETHEDAGPEIDRKDLRQLLLDSLAPDTVAWGHVVEGGPFRSGRPVADGHQGPGLLSPPIS